jgi:hypothetical protein
MSGNLPAGIVLTNPQWFDECLRRGCTVFDFPPNRSPRNVDKLRPGSVCLVLVRPRPGTPRGEWAFVGEFTVRDVERVRGEEFSSYAPRAVETEVPFPKPGEASWIIEFERIRKYDRQVRLSECGDVRTSTSGKPLSKWAITGFTYIRPEDAAGFLEAVRRKARSEEGARGHDELVGELLELGAGWASWRGGRSRRRTASSGST